jgi:alkylhydroperoxidase/carboxymuconolactone decarboxylase family protein YurZ
MEQLHPVLDDMMLEYGYGRVLSRPGLSLRLRELCVVAALAGQDVAPQLVRPAKSDGLSIRSRLFVLTCNWQSKAARPPPQSSHLRGALRSGSTKDELAAVISHTELAWGPAAAAQARAHTHVHAHPPLDTLRFRGSALA